MSTDYTLTLSFSQDDLQTLHKVGQQLVVVRSFQSAAPGNVAWAVIKPLQSLRLEWNRTYKAYASLAEFSDGKPIQVNGTTTDSVRFQNRYAFIDNCTFSSPIADDSLDAGEVALINKYSATPIVTFGLLQSLQVAGQPSAAVPCIATLVPQESTASFQPLEKLTLFLSTSAATGAFIKVPAAQELAVTSPPTLISFPAGTTRLAYTYTTGTFVPTS